MKQIQKKFDLQISFKVDNKIEKHEFNLKHNFFINVAIFFTLLFIKKVLQENDIEMYINMEKKLLSHTFF